jgi:magnesium transporter
MSINVERMASFTTFYLSRILDKRVYDTGKKYVGTIKDLLIDSHIVEEGQRPLVRGIVLKNDTGLAYYKFEHFVVLKKNNRIKVKCHAKVPLSKEEIDKLTLLKEIFLDKQIVDLNGRKLVRVNDIRLITLKEISFVIAVDIGTEGLLRRIGIAKQTKAFFSLFKVNIPAKFILWEDVEAIDFSNQNIKLSKTYSKLHTLHPSDIAAIIEEMGNKSITELFSSLDEEKAADVFEELEPETQVQIIESLPVEKMADVLEKMPADEVADIMDELSDEKAEILLNEMEHESSQEVRELLEYPEDSVGSIMTTDIISFKESQSISEILKELRISKPEPSTLYNLFSINEKGKLIGTFSLRDIVVSEPETTIREIMRESPAHLHELQPVDDIAEIISKYNMLAIPVVDDDDVLQGMVVIDDIVEDLIDKRKTNKN